MNTFFGEKKYIRKYSKIPFYGILGYFMNTYAKTAFLGEIPKNLLFKVPKKD